MRGWLGKEEKKSTCTTQATYDGILNKIVVFQRVIDKRKPDIKLITRGKGGKMFAFLKKWGCHKAPNSLNIPQHTEICAITFRAIW